MELTQIKYEVNDRVALITHNRPEQMNAVTHQMCLELIHAFDQADQDDDVRAVVVTGEGRAFCAGADLSGGGSFRHKNADGSPQRLAEHRDGGGTVVMAMQRCRKPVIAAINGPAVGVGITMTLGMDMRVVAEDAKIGFVFSQRGLVMEACSSWFLPRLVGMTKAAELVYTGRVFRAKEQADSGLFNYVVPREEVLPKAMELAREIAENTSAMSVTLNKALLKRGLIDPDPQTTHMNDSRAFIWVATHEDAAEGIQSFLQKRPPEFKLSPTKDLPDFYPWWVEPKV
jgi:enoyl-CoA hydratase/carnithine racemase